MSFFPRHVVICVTQNEPDGCKKVGLSRTVSSDDNIVMGREILDNSLVFVRFKSSDDDTLDVHIRLVAVWVIFEKNASKLYQAEMAMINRYASNS